MGVQVFHVGAIATFRRFSQSRMCLGFERTQLMQQTQSLEYAPAPLFNAGNSTAIGAGNGARAAALLGQS